MRPEDANMKSRFLAFVALAGCFLAPQASLAQPAVERLERRVRDLDQRPEGSKAEDTGYLGVVADDRAAVGSGVDLIEVVDGSPAEKAGLKAGDVVTKIGDHSIRTLDDFADALRDLPVGSAVRFTIEREGEPKQAEAKLAARPPAQSRRFPNFGRLDEAGPRMSLLGVRVEPVDSQSKVAEKLPVAKGAYVVRVAEGSPAAIAGIPVQSVIVAVDGQEVADPDDLKQLIAATRPGQEIKVDYYSRGKLVERRVTLAEFMPESPVVATDEPPQAADGPAEPLTDQQRIEQLERRVRSLEARLAEFERFLGGR
jgi:S1-C subfamily serine protease